MIRLLPRTPRVMWLLAGVTWLAGCAILWSMLPFRPRAAWPTEGPAVLHGFIPGTSVLLTSSPWNSGMEGRPGPLRGPLLARDVATGEVREWFPDTEWLTLVVPGTDGRHVVIGRVVRGLIDGGPRLFLHDTASGAIVAELPRKGVQATVYGQPPYVAEQFAEFRADGRRIVYFDREGEQTWLHVWDVEARREVAAIADAEPPAAWSPHGRTVAYTNRARNQNTWRVCLWEVDEGITRALGSSPLVNDQPVQIRFSSDGQTVVSVLRSRRQSAGREPPDDVAGWDVASGSQTFRRMVHRAVFLANVPWFVSDEWTDPPGATFIHRCDWATGAGQGLTMLTPAGNWVWDSISPDGRLVFGCAEKVNPVLELLDRYLPGGVPGGYVVNRPQVWACDTGRLQCSLPMPVELGYGRTPQNCWSSDGKLLAIATTDSLTVWDIPPRKPLSWFAAGAALLALPSLMIARRGVLRFRREAAGPAEHRYSAAGAGAQCTGDDHARFATGRR